MAVAPKIIGMNVLQQGGLMFPTACRWTDSVASTGTKTDYDLDAVRAAMGLVANEPLFVVFSADGPFWANFYNAAVIPTATTGDGTASEYGPNQRYLDSSVHTISIISAAAQKVSMQFYRP